SGSDSLVGTSGDDSINGLDGNDAIDGLDGNDTIDGGNGSDSIYGRAGNDVLICGDGDTIEGGAGADTFVFVGRSGSVTDFTSGTDKLSFDGSIFPGIGSSGNFTADDPRFFG